MNAFLNKIRPIMKLEYFFMFYVFTTILSYTSEKYLPISRSGWGVVLMVWGIVLFIYQWIDQPTKKFKKQYLWLLAFLGSYALTTLLNRQYQFVGNVKILLYSGLQMLLVYPVLFERNRKEGTLFFKRMGFFTVAIITLLNIISLVGYFVSFRAYSFAFYRLWGVYFDPNFGGLLTGMAMWMGYYLFTQAKKNSGKIMAVIVLFINAGYIILSQSRSAFVAMIIGIAFILGVEIYRYVVLKIRKQQMMSMGLLIVLFFTILFKNPIGAQLQNVAVFIQYGPSADVSEIESDFDEGESFDVFGERDDENKSESTRQRLNAWKAALEVFSERPVLGTGYAGYIEALTDLADTSLLGAKNKDMHNGYLVLLAGSGLIGFSIMVSFLIWIALRVFKKFNVLLKDEAFIAIMGVLGCMAISIVFISDIFLINSVVSLWFWALLAIMNKMAQEA